jgi:hypothetical protein
LIVWPDMAQKKGLGLNFFCKGDWSRGPCFISILEMIMKFPLQSDPDAFQSESLWSGILLDLQDCCLLGIARWLSLGLCHKERIGLLGCGCSQFHIHSLHGLFRSWHQQLIRSVNHRKQIFALFFYLLLCGGCSCCVISSCVPTQPLGGPVEMGYHMWKI